MNDAKTREERLKAALRNNLQRRKAQVRARSQQAEDSGDRPSETEPPASVRKSDAQ